MYAIVLIGAQHFRVILLGASSVKTYGKAKPMILSTSNNFSRIMHPFAVDKEWFKGFDNKDMKNIDGYSFIVTEYLRMSAMLLKG